MLTSAEQTLVEIVKVEIQHNADAERAFNYILRKADEDAPKPRKINAIKAVRDEIDSYFAKGSSPFGLKDHKLFVELALEKAFELA